MVSNQVGESIRTYRQKMGLSQERLAELVGVSSQQIQKYESGYTTLNIKKLQQIADVLKVSVGDFFEPISGGCPSRLTGQEEQLLESFRRIKNSEMRDCILKIVGNINKRVK